MQLFDAGERRLAQTISDLSYCNPFLPDRIDLERKALGPHFEQDQRVWSFQSDDQAERANIRHLIRLTEELVRTLRDRLMERASANELDLRLYEGCVLYVLYHQGQRTLSALSSKDLHQEVNAPTCHSSFHGIAFFSGMLFDQTQSETA